MQNILKKKFSAKFSIFILEISAVTVLIVALTVVRYIGGGVYSDLKNWYILHFGTDTKISEVMGENSETDENSQDKEFTESQTKTATQTDEGILSVSAKVYDIEQKDAAVSSCNSLYFPLDNAQLSSHFGARVNPITHNDERHKGVDLATEENSPVFAAADGEVEYAALSPTYGNYIIISHGQGLKTLYAHCNKLLVSAGDKVSRGEKIALVGSTGQSTAPHLHFEVRVNDTNINPEWLLEW